MFAALEAVDISDLFRDMRVWVSRVNDASDDVSFADLSDGERQLLMVLGLTRVARGKHTLFLLDEPDTHLNPVWQHSYLDLIRDWTGIAAHASNCQIVLTSHNPLTIAALTIAALTKEEVRMMFTDEAGKVTVSAPYTDPRGMGFTATLTEIFGLPSSLDPETQREVDERNALARIEQRTEQQERQLIAINDKLNRLGFMFEDREPPYQDFLRAWQDVRYADRPPLSPEQIEKRHAAMAELIKELHELGENRLMIYVRCDSNLIPKKLLQVAERAQQKLEELPAEERPAFIKKKSHVWRAFARYLSKMSYGKCWYSESLDPQSFFDVDHCRPKLQARRSDEVTDPGYTWLAFSWENFRLSAQRSNRVSKNEETDANEGKGDWFPLLESSPKACWENRCEATEQPVLLDPGKKADIRLIEVLDDGRMGPSRICIGSSRLRVERSIELYGLNFPRLKAARLKAMREVNELHSVLSQILEAAAPAVAVEDGMPIDTLVESITSKTLPSSAYSKAARTQLMRLPGGAALCAQPEEVTDQ